MLVQQQAEKLEQLKAYVEDLREGYYELFKRQLSKPGKQDGRHLSRFVQLGVLPVDQIKARDSLMAHDIVKGFVQSVESGALKDPHQEFRRSPPAVEERERRVD